MMKKSNDRRSFIKKITAATTVAIVGATAGFSIDNKKPTKNTEVKNIQPLGFQWATRDPFLFCVHHEDYYPNGNKNLGPDASLAGRQIGQDFIVKDGWRMYHGQTVPGFPFHPHRGFETVTVVRTGLVDHSDSLGASGRYGNGDVQWMTAGKGVQHAEMFPCINQDSDNPLELFQIWLNLPSSSKFVEPHYKMLWEEEIPKHIHTDANGKKTLVEVIAGRIENDKAPTPPPNSWANDQSNEVAIWNIKMEAGATWNLPKASEEINRTLYFYKGGILNVSGQEVKHYHSAEIEANTDILFTSGTEDCHILILQGKPIGEPVVQHGPFVMNTREEIQQAFEDYQRTQFGGWPWNSNSPVSPQETGRFAKYSDGTEEVKS